VLVLRLCSTLSCSAVDDNDDDDEATGDNPTLFSEVKLSGDIDTSIGNGMSSNGDFRLNRLVRSTDVDRRTSIGLTIQSVNVIDMDKVSRIS
jgi:hypothetical protein